MTPTRSLRFTFGIGALGPALFFLVPAWAQEAPMVPSKVEMAVPREVATQPPAAAAAAPAPGRSRGTPNPERPLDDATKARLKEEARSAPAVAPQTELATPDDRASKPARLQKDFAGANRAMFELNPNDPPNTNAAASAHRVIEAVHTGVRMTDFNGKSELRKSLASLFGESDAEFLHDPRVLYDRNSANPRFIVATLHKVFSPQGSFLHIAVSRSDNPLTFDPSDWCTYKIDASIHDPNIDGAGNPGVRFADFDRIGTGADSLSVVTNEFPFPAVAANGIVTQLRVLDKTALENNASACPTSPVYTFDISAKPADSISAFTAYPIQHYTSPSSFPGADNPAYLVGDSDFGGRDYTIWRIANVAAGSPTVESIHVNSDILLALQPPPPAKQLGTSNTLSNLDFRISGTAGLGDALWATHSNACNVGGGDEESCIVVLRFEAGQDDAGRMTAAISQSHTFGGDADGVSFWMPAIAVTQDEQTVVTFLTSNPNSFLSTWFTSKALTDPAYQPPTILTTGTCADPENQFSPFVVRTGDYVGAASAPDLRSVWISGERLVPFPPEFGAPGCMWDTWIGRAVP